MDCAIRPIRFATDEEWVAYKHVYQKRYNKEHRERKRLLATGEVAEKKRRTHAKKRRK